MCAGLQISVLALYLTLYLIKGPICYLIGVQYHSFVQFVWYLFGKQYLMGIQQTYCWHISFSRLFILKSTYGSWNLELSLQMTILQRLQDFVRLRTEFILNLPTRWTWQGLAISAQHGTPWFVGSAILCLFLWQVRLPTNTTCINRLDKIGIAGNN